MNLNTLIQTLLDNHWETIALIAGTVLSFCVIKPTIEWLRDVMSGKKKRAGRAQESLREATKADTVESVKEALETEREALRDTIQDIKDAMSVDMQAFIISNMAYWSTDRKLMFEQTKGDLLRDKEPKPEEPSDEPKPQKRAIALRRKRSA